MGTIDMISLTREELEEWNDQTKVVILGALVRDGLLTSDVADSWAKANTVIYRKKGIFRTLSDLWNKESESRGLYALVVKRT